MPIRYSLKLADFVPSLWYGREGAGQEPYHHGTHGVWTLIKPESSRLL